MLLKLVNDARKAPTSTSMHIKRCVDLNHRNIKVYTGQRAITRAAFFDNPKATLCISMCIRYRSVPAPLKGQSKPPWFFHSYTSFLQEMIVHRRYPAPTERLFGRARDEMASRLQ